MKVEKRFRLVIKQYLLSKHCSKNKSNQLLWFTKLLPSVLFKEMEEIIQE